MNRQFSVCRDPGKGSAFNFEFDLTKSDKTYIEMESDNIPKEQSIDNTAE